MLNFWIDVLLVIFVVDCAFMGLVIMMQRSKQEGLGAAFGGGFTESIWGAQTSQVLVKATAWAAALFFILSVSLARLYSMSESGKTAPQSSAVQQALEQTPTPKPAVTNAAPVTPSASLTAPTNAPAALNPAPAKIPTH